MNQSLVWLPVIVVQGEDVEQILRKVVILVATYGIGPPWDKYIPLNLVIPQFLNTIDSLASPTTCFNKLQTP